MNFSSALAGDARLNVFEGIDLHSNIDEHTFSLLQQGCATVIDVAGRRAITSDEELNSEIRRVVDILRAFFKSPGHQIDFSLTRDPDRGGDAVRFALSDAMVAAKSSGIAAEDLFEDTIATLAKVVAFERGLIVIKTSLFALKPEEVKAQVAKSNNAPFIKAIYGASASFVGGERLLNAHKIAVDMFLRAMSAAWVLKPLSVKDALRRIRQEVAPEMTPESWMPVTWGDDIPFGKFVPDEDDISQLTPAAFGVQLFPQQPHISDDPSIFRLGSRYIAPLNFFMLPQYPRRFSTLFENIDDKLPFRLTISIETGGDAIRSRLGMKKRIAQLFSLGSQRNKNIAHSANYILGRLKENMPLVIIRANVCTWGNTLEQAQLRKTQVVNEFTAWGAPELRDNLEFPFTTWLETIPGVSIRRASLPAPYFADEALRLMPIDRPSALWDKGAFLLRSEDGKLLPVKLFSKKQTTWNGLSLALPGSGKTVFLLARMFASLFQPSASGLPFQVLLDIGFSSEGYIDLVKSMLRPEDQDLAILNRMQLSKDEIINPFDTPLGFDSPPPEDLTFAQGFLESVVTPADGDVESVVTDAAAKLARQAYQYKLDKPTPYTPGMFSEIDRAIQDCRIELHAEPYWSEVRDELFKAGKVKLAGLAHRQALPNFTDLASIIAEDSSFNSQYASRMLSNGTSVKDELRRLVLEAVDAYPNLAGPSTFDFGRARIIAYNLNAVAGDTSAKLVKQTRIMYSLAKKAGTRGYFIDTDSLRSAPALYARYHRERVAELKNTPKWLIYEEFHTPAKAKNKDGTAQVVSEADTEMRTGRKYTVGVDSVSQHLSDYSDEMITQSTSAFIFDASDEDMVAQVATRFKLSAAITQRMRTFLTGPGPSGAPVIARWKVKKVGTTVQEALLTLGPQSLWAFCSTEEDVHVRRILARRLGMKKAIKVLADRFPGGTLADQHDGFVQQISRFEPAFAQVAKKYGKDIMVEAMLTLPKSDFLGICEGRLSLSKDIAMRVLKVMDAA